MIDISIIIIIIILRYTYGSTRLNQSVSHW